MNTTYTDVDRLMLDRWNDVIALFEARDELLSKITNTIDTVCQRVGPWLEENGYEWEGDEKHPSIWAWKKDWEKPRGEPLITLEISDFAPIGFGRVENDNPWMWVRTDNLERIRLKAPDRVRFARDLKAALGTAASKWEHEDCEEDSEPLGRYCTDVSDQQRLELVKQPARMVEFLQAGFKEMFELVPALDETLRKYREPR